MFEKRTMIVDENNFETTLEKLSTDLNEIGDEQPTEKRMRRNIPIAKENWLKMQ